jgi:hypothetical protein
MQTLGLVSFFLSARNSHLKVEEREAGGLGANAGWVLAQEDAMH